MCHVQLEEYPKAIVEFKKSLELEPEFDIALGNLGWAYYCIEELEQCVYYSKKAISLNPDAFYAKFNLALAKLRLGEIDEAKRLYSKYYEESVQKEIDLNGAISDLEDLKSRNILVEESSFILKEILEASK